MALEPSGWFFPRGNSAGEDDLERPLAQLYFGWLAGVRQRVGHEAVELVDFPVEFLLLGDHAVAQGELVRLRLSEQVVGRGGLLDEGAHLLRGQFLRERVERPSTFQRQRLGQREVLQRGPGELVEPLPLGTRDAAPVPSVALVVAVLLQPEARGR